jgi:uncharacterized protein GlcG (DUF336 family)
MKKMTQEEPCRIGITLEMALETARGVIKLAKSYEDEPIAITIAGPKGQPIVLQVMDGTIGSSRLLSWRKAYTSVMTEKSTLHWEKMNLDPRNFGDPNITCFGGGVPVVGVNGKIMGAIGISGRKTHKVSQEEKADQDHELAEYGVRYLTKMLETVG